MSTVLKWFGVLVIVLSLLALAFGSILALEIAARIPVVEKGSGASWYGSDDYRT